MNPRGVSFFSAASSRLSSRSRIAVNRSRVSRPASVSWSMPAISASALIDEACGLTGNALMIGEGPTDDLRVLFQRLPVSRQVDLVRLVLSLAELG